jgi:uncharacterized protein
VGVVSTPAADRVIDLDVARAVALIGVVVMNYHGYLILDGGTQGTSFVNRVFNPWMGPLSTRFAATFVLIAGMGVTLMTNRSRLCADVVMRSDDRWKLVRRGMVLYAGGYVLNWVWDGTILFYYGAFFLVGALLFALKSRWIAVVGVLAACAAAVLQWWRFEQSEHGRSTGWLFSPTEHSPRGLLFDTFVNGTHPLLPWLAFFCAGIIIGRMLPLRAEWKIIVALGGLMLTIFTYLVHSAAATSKLGAKLLATDPSNRGLLYTVGTLTTAVAAFCIVGSIAQATRDTVVTKALAAAGRTTLTIYVLHVLVFNLVVHRLGWIRPTGLDTAWLFAGGFWVVTILAAAWWQRRFGMGPLERVYRRFGGESAAPRTGSGEPGQLGQPAQLGQPGQSGTPISANVPAH